MDSRLLALGLGALAVMGGPRAAAAEGLAGPRKHPVGAAAPGDLAAVSSRAAALSVGWPTGGRLVGGVELQPGVGLSLVRAADARFGLPALVGMLTRSGKRVALRHPGSRIAVGDLSRRQGGEIDGHRSHESGRDVDVGFFLVDARGRPVPEGRFAAVDEQGRATAARDRGLRFDEVRNWSLIQAWLTDPGARVLHVFVAAPLRQRLLDEARRRGVSVPLLHRAGLALRQPSRGAPHDDHFHVRIACPRVQRDVCAEEPPRAEEPVASRRRARPEARWQAPSARRRVGL